LSDETLKIVKWSGKKADYALWANLFVGYCAVKDSREALLGLGTPIPTEAEVLDPTKSVDVPKIAARKANLKAYHLLTLYCQDPVSAMAFLQSKTTDLPSGDAPMAWKALERLYKPVTQDKKNKLKNDFKSSKLKTVDQNPDEWFSDLALIRLQLLTGFKFNIDDDDMIGHIVYNVLPIEYDNTMGIIRASLKGNNPPDLEEVKEQI
jgi:hypothetical protein